jgi:anti-sigma factor RsiW
MFCDEALDAVEAIAAGELTPEGRIAAHLESCPNCAAALASARTLDEMLRSRAVPAPPANFTTKTLARVRRERWKSDQVVDFAFNLTLGAFVLAAVGGVWLLLVRSGFVAVGGGAFDLAETAVVAAARRMVAARPVYSGAAALLGTALIIWWWAERDAAA